MAIQAKLSNQERNTYVVKRPKMNTNVPVYMARIPITTNKIKTPTAVPSCRKKSGANAIATKNGKRVARLKVI